MLHESRRKNLKILIAPLSIKLSSLKSTETVSTVVPGINNLYFITTINGHILRTKKENMTFYDLIILKQTSHQLSFFAIIGFISFCATKKI